MHEQGRPTIGVCDGGASEVNGGVQSWGSVFFLKDGLAARASSMKEQLQRAASSCGVLMTSEAGETGSAARHVARRDWLAVLIVDDCCVYRDGLAAMMEREPAVHEVRTAFDRPSIARALDHWRPNVVLVNLASVDSRSLMELVRLGAPRAPIVAIGVGDDDREILGCAEAGIAGYLLRNDPFDHLVRLVRHVAAGETICSPRVTAALMRRLAQLADERAKQVPVLTAREDQILELLDVGLSNQEIADRLCIELRTVKNHLHNIFGKLGVSRRGEAVARLRAIRGAGGASPQPASITV